jgi:DUF1680 family protein
MDGEAALTLQDGEIRLAGTFLNGTGQSQFILEILEATYQPIRLKVRVPDWSGPFHLIVNGDEISYETRNGYAGIERAWKAGDRLEARFALEARVQRGQTLGRHILAADEAAIFYGPRLFCLNDSLNPAARLHLVKLKLPASPAEGVSVLTPTRLEVVGTSPDRPVERLVFSPLAEIGGTASGSGRIHTMRSPYYKVWIPVAS